MKILATALLAGSLLATVRRLTAAVAAEAEDTGAVAALAQIPWVASAGDMLVALAEVTWLASAAITTTAAVHITRHTTGPTAAPTEWGSDSEVAGARLSKSSGVRRQLSRVSQA